MIEVVEKEPIEVITLEDTPEPLVTFPPIAKAFVKANRKKLRNAELFGIGLACLFGVISQYYRFSTIRWFSILLFSHVILFQPRLRRPELTGGLANILIREFGLKF